MISTLHCILHVIVRDLFTFHNEFSFAGSSSLGSELCSELEPYLSNLSLETNNHSKISKKHRWLEVSSYHKMCGFPLFKNTIYRVHHISTIWVKRLTSEWKAPALELLHCTKTTVHIMEGNRLCYAYEIIQTYLKSSLWHPQSTLGVTDLWFAGRCFKMPGVAGERRHKCYRNII